MSKLIIHEGSLYRVGDREYSRLLLAIAAGHGPQKPDGTLMGTTHRLIDFTPDEAERALESHEKRMAENKVSKKLNKARAAQP